MKEQNRAAGLHFFFCVHLRQLLCAESIHSRSTSEAQSHFSRAPEPLELMKPSLIVLALFCITGNSAGQTLPTDDAVLRRIWAVGMDSSRTWELAQALFDSVGPRLTGSPQQKAGNDWLLARYREWGIPARNEQYGTWKGWRRGPTHIDLMTPRVRTLEGTADPEQVPHRWRQLAFRGYLALQRLDAAVLEPRLPASLFYNLVLSARKSV